MSDIGILFLGFGFGAGLAVTSWLISWGVIPFVGRYRQAGREGFGFEKTGIARWRTAWGLWVKYDLPDMFD